MKPCSQCGKPFLQKRWNHNVCEDPKCSEERKRKHNLTKKKYSLGKFKSYEQKRNYKFSGA